jgi:magnesium chelatase family protein
VTLNLAPVDIKKESTGFDLPIAIGILACEELIKENALQDCFFIGELSLHGSIKSLRVILPATLKARELCISKVFVPVENAAEAVIMAGIAVYGVSTLPDVVEFFNNR